MYIFRKRLIKTVLIIAASVIIIQVLVEFGLKFVMVPVWPTYFLPHHYPASKIQTAAGTVSANWISNSQGFHDVEHDFGKIANKVRIVTIGDSFLDGPQQDPLPSVLFSSIREERDNIEVINLSRPGIDTNLYYLLFKHALPTYQPDIVLIFIYEGNDFRAMENLSPDFYEQPDSFFQRYPLSSYYGIIFPRSSIFISDIFSFSHRFIHRWSNIPQHARWGKPNPKRNLEEISEDITKYIEADSATVHQFIIDRLTKEEINELTSFGVRIDLLAYMTSIGLEAKFTSRLGVKEHRPEINNETVATKQVESVFSFLRAMNDTTLQKEIEFYCVLIPTSYVDPKANDMYARLGADQDPLFIGTRMKQMVKLKQLLIHEGIEVIDLRNVLNGESDSYLKFDTHWDVKGVNISADYISKYLIEKSKRLTR